MKVSNSKFAHFGHFGHLVISTLFTSIAGSLMLACLCRADTAPTFIDQINFSLVDRICLDGRIDSAFVNSQNEDLFLARGFQYLRFPIQADEGESGSNGTLSISRKLGAFQSESGDSLNKNCSLLSDSSKVTSMFEIDAARVYSTNEQLTELYYQDDSSCQTKKAIEVFNKEISDQIERQKFKRVFMYRSLLLFFSDKTFAIVRTRSLKPVHEFKFYGLFTSDLIDSNFPTNVQSILSIGSHVWIVSDNSVYEISDAVFNDRLTWLQHFKDVKLDASCDSNPRSTTTHKILKTLTQNGTPSSNLTTKSLKDFFHCSSAESILRKHFDTRSCLLWIILFVVSLLVILAILAFYERERVKRCAVRCKACVVKRCDYKKCCSVQDTLPSP